MQNLSRKDKELLLKLNTEGLTPTQLRLVKSVHALLANVLASDEESEYFDTSAELLKKTAELIKHANFAIENKSMEYGHQAIEFSVENLNDSLDQNKIQNLDN